MSFIKYSTDVLMLGGIMKTVTIRYPFKDQLILRIVLTVKLVTLRKY